MLILKDIKPLGDSVITTGNRYDEVYTEGGLLNPTKSREYKPYQTVLFASEQAIARGIVVGQKVAVNFYNYARPIQKEDTLKESTDQYYKASIAYHIPVIDINKKECLDLRICDIKCVILDMEETEVPKKTSKLLLN